MTDIFPGVIQSNPDLLEEINYFEGDLQLVDNTLLFTIPALFRFTCQSFARHSEHQIESSKENYLGFRKLLYKNPTNTELKILGGHIDIDTVNKKHELCIYKLTPIPN